MSVTFLLLLVVLIGLLGWLHLRQRKLETELVGARLEVEGFSADLEGFVTHDELETLLSQRVVPSVLRESQAISNEGDRFLEATLAARLRSSGIDIEGCSRGSAHRGQGGVVEDEEPATTRRRRRPSSGSTAKEAMAPTRASLSSSYGGTANGSSIGNEGGGLRSCVLWEDAAGDGSLTGRREAADEEEEDESHVDGEEYYSGDGVALDGVEEWCGGEAEEVDGMQEVLTNVAQIFGSMGGRHDVRVRAGEVRSARMIITSPPPRYAVGGSAGSPRIVGAAPATSSCASIEELGDSDLEDACEPP